MNFLKQNIVPIVVGTLLLVGIFVYLTFFAGSSSPAALTSGDNQVVLSQSVLQALQNLHTIKLDNSIFSEPAYQSLTDFGVVIPPEAIGRRNPFEPVTGVSLGTSGGNVTLPKTTK
jgi:hypothetical protein